jgi:hypothetical protein
MAARSAALTPATSSSRAGRRVTADDGTSSLPFDPLRRELLASDSRNSDGPHGALVAELEGTLMGLFNRENNSASKLAERVATFLEPDEQAKWTVPAQGGAHPFMMLVPAFLAVIAVVATANSPVLQIVLVSVTVFLVVAALSTSRYRLLAVTDDDVVILRTRALRPTKPVEFLGRVSRVDKFNVAGSFWGLIVVDGDRLWVHKRFHGQIKDADENLGRGVMKRGSSNAYRANRAKKKVKNVRRR